MIRYMIVYRPVETIGIDSCLIGPLDWIRL